MSDRDRYIPGVPCWVDTTQPDPEAAVEFYGELFGWELENSMPPDAPGKYFNGRLRGEHVAAISSPPPSDAPPRAVWNTYVWVESADETAAKVRDAGGAVTADPFDVMEAGRMAVCTDREGAAFGIWQAGEHRGAKIVNVPGSLNFNTLNTRDVSGAAAFYGAVFGWEVLPVGGGEMWALPGYGRFLDEINPGTLDNMAEVGAPEGFENVVASLAPIPDDQPETAPHWSVTFGVDDADAIAAKASELGGAVVAGPFDAPWSRIAVIRDPQGATFTASKFVPENRDLA